MSDPDFKQLRKVNRELDELFDAGKLSKEEWDRLLGDAREAVAGHTEFLEGTYLQGMRYGFVTPPSA